MPIFRRTNCIITASGIVTVCKRLYGMPDENGQSANRRLSIPLGKHATVFQAEVYAILACAHETEAQDWPEKYVSICSDRQAALKALQVAKTTSPLVRQCQQALNDISAWHAVRLYWVPGHAGVRGNETADRLARSGSCQRFIGPEPFWGCLGRI